MKKALFGSLVFAALVTCSAFGQFDYNNGPINGTTDAWTINMGFAVSDTFTASSGDTLTGLSFGAWLFQGDILETAEVQIGTSEYGNTLYDQVLNFTQGGCIGNQFGFNVCTETATISNGPTFNGGTFWLTLLNATVNTGDPIYWDENSGPSSASENSVGTIPSEAFTLELRPCIGDDLHCTTSSSSTTPEPSALLLLVSGGIASFGFWPTVRKRG